MDLMKKVPVREQDPSVRAHNFDEVCLGYNKDEAMAEASRCLNCKNPQCVTGCPVSINIPGFIAKVKDGDFKAAYDRHWAFAVRGYFAVFKLGNGPVKNVTAL